LPSKKQYNVSQESSQLSTAVTSLQITPTSATAFSVSPPAPFLFGSQSLEDSIAKMLLNLPQPPKKAYGIAEQFGVDAEAFLGKGDTIRDEGEDRWKSMIKGSSHQDDEYVITKISRKKRP
jgi:hypothetical protein